MAVKIFYAWQSDRPSVTNKKFIRAALDDAVQQLHDTIVDEPDQPKQLDLEVDQDTQGEAGLVDIADTIKKKIIEDEVFVCDLTHVGSYKTADGRVKKCQNGNVLIELGFAIRNIDPKRIICVMNGRWGGGSHLPFDLNKFRHPFTYNLSPQSDESRVQLQHKKLVNFFKTAVPQSLKAVSRDRVKENQRNELSLKDAGRLRAEKIRDDLRTQLGSYRFARMDVGKRTPIFMMTFVPLLGEQQISLTENLQPEAWLRPLYPSTGRIFYDIDSVGTEYGQQGEQVFQKMAVTRFYRDCHLTAVARIDSIRWDKDDPYITTGKCEDRMIEQLQLVIEFCLSRDIRGPWQVSADLLNVINLKFLDKMNLMYLASDTGGPYQHNVVSPDPVEIPADIRANDRKKVTAMLKPIFDGFWRAAGFFECHRFDREGNCFRTG